MAQMVEFLPSKCEALSSNPSTAKQQNKKIKAHTYNISTCENEERG
jgi:hypothetical protein